MPRGTHLYMAQKRKLSESIGLVREVNSLIRYIASPKPAEQHTSDLETNVKLRLGAAQLGDCYHLHSVRLLKDVLDKNPWLLERKSVQDTLRKALKSRLAGYYLRDIEIPPRKEQSKKHRVH